MELSAIVFFPLGRIKRLAVGQPFILCVPQHKMGYIKAFSQFTGLFHGTVMLFIGLKTIPVLIEAECLMEKPGTSLYIRYTLCA